MKRGVWLLVALAAVASLVAVLASGFGSDPHAVPFLLDGKPAPDFTMRRLDNGLDFRFSELQGKPAVLNFWSTWCGPCKVEAPVLEWGQARFGREVNFVGIVFEDNEENTRNFLKKYPSHALQLFDPKSTVAVDYGVSGVPETYFISKNGLIVKKIARAISPEELETGVQELLR